MKWSLKLGRFLGIDVHLHFTFLLLLVFIGAAHWMTGGGPQAALAGLSFLALLFLCVLLHEYGHALMARRFGIATREITLLPIGGVAQLERMPDRPLQELWVALAGPAVNVVIAAGLAFWLTLSGGWAPLASLSTTDGPLLERLLAANLFLIGFNLLPAFPMDGGRVLRALLAMRLPYVRATRIAARIGQGMAVVFGLVGLLGHPLLLFIAVFVWLGAAQESAAAELKTSFANARSGDAMITDFRLLAPRSTLGEAAEHMLAGEQRNFPVAERGRVMGAWANCFTVGALITLHQADLFAALREHGELAPVDQVMRRNFATVDATVPLAESFAKVQGDNEALVLVIDGERVVGLLTPENVIEFHLVSAALAPRRPDRTTPPPASESPRSLPPVLHGFATPAIEAPR